MIPRPKLEQLNKGTLELERYANSDMNLQDWKLTKVLDNILFVQYVDASEDGKEIKRNGIFVPIDVVNFTWRVGRVILAGPDCRTVKEGDYVVFPNDKGIQVANLNDHKNVVFLNEDRIFGVVETK
jgi:co-chaperonin GroES (HSP10)